MPEQEIFGEYDERGNLVRDTHVCILSGVPIEPGDATFGVGRYFYRVSASAMKLHTPEARAEILKMIPKDTAKKPVSTKASE